MISRLQALEELRARRAELLILEEYDHARHELGHDYGNGQRSAELSRRRSELREAESLERMLGAESHELEREPSREELRAACSRMLRPRLDRASSEDYRRSTPSTSRTLRALARVLGRYEVRS